MATVDADGKVVLGEGETNLSEELRKYDPGRQALASLVSPMFRELWHTALTCLEEALPEHAKTGTADARQFGALRSRILNAGNGQLRELPAILANFAVVEVIKREVVARVMVAGCHGPFNLPPNVRMPTDKP